MKIIDRLLDSLAERIATRLAPDVLLMRQRVAEDMQDLKAEIRTQRDRIEVLKEFQGTVECAGVRRKFGGVVDVDYDKLLNVLGPEGEAEMRRTLNARKREARLRLLKKK